MLKRTQSKQKSVPKAQEEAALQEEHIDLAQYSSGEDDSSDEEGGGDGPELPGIDITSLPTVAKDDATVARKLAAAKKQQKKSVRLSCIYTGVIPGF